MSARRNPPSKACRCVAWMAALVVAFPLVARSAQPPAMRRKIQPRARLLRQTRARPTVRRVVRRPYDRRVVRRRWWGPHLEPHRVRQIQRALIQAGYLTGPPTGVWDQATTDAMRRYQAANGFDVTGLPEAKPLMKLGLGPHPLPPGVPAATPADVDPNPPADIPNPPAHASRR